MRRVEIFATEIIQNVFDNFAFENIEHRAVEPVNSLLAKGETSKEIYLLNRLQEAYESENGNINLVEKLNSPKQLGLHFDLTVPFARYVLENSGQLQFPFRRSSIGKVWRGERPQAGRFREFTQADVDIVGAVPVTNIATNTAFPLIHDVDVVKCVGTALNKLQKLGTPKCQIHVNNRKLLQGIYENLQITDCEKVLQIVDKLPKIGADKVIELLKSNVNITDDIANICVDIALVKTNNVIELLKNETVSAAVNSNDLAKIGYEELQYFMSNFSQNEHVKQVHVKQVENSVQTAISKQSAIQSYSEIDVIIDLSITRGLDYYTGLVFETFLCGFENFGSVASGGRYDNLTSSFGDNQKIKYPGVGMSIGLTRLLSIAFANNLISEDLLEQFEKSADVMVIVNCEETRPQSNDACLILRSNNVSAFVSPNDNKFGKQIDFAYKRGIPYVLFINENDEYQLKNILTGEQKQLADLSTLTKESFSPNIIDKKVFK